jgi:uncharacterized protein (DUF1778 family)
MVRQRIDAEDIRDQVIRIRASKQQIELIDRAARTLNMSRSEFIRETMCQEAERIVLDQVHFRLDAEAYAQLSTLLEAPPAPSDALRTLLQTKAPWD